MRAPPANTSLPLRAIVQSARRAFTARFGTPPAYIAAAPGRVNLIGDHTDYNGGFVLPIAIDRWTVVAGAPTRGNEPGNAYSVELNEQATVAAPRPPRSSSRRGGAFASYVNGTAALFAKHVSPLPPVNLLVHSNVPIGAGLSSSAAMCVALATCFEQASGRSIDALTKARLCQSVEHDYAGVPCGLMDQLVITHAQAEHAILIDCATDAMRHIRLRANAQLAFIVVNTGIRHELASSGYGGRRSECEAAAACLGVPLLAHAQARDVNSSKLPKPLRPLARHVTSEHQRTRRAADAIESGDIDMLGRLMFESHASLRDDFRVSCEELDAVVEAAHALASHGVLGARMTGGGFGGCAIVLCRADVACDMANAFASLCAEVGMDKSAAFEVHAVGAAGAVAVE